MLTKRVLCFFIFTLSAITVIAQNCNDLVGWMNLIKQEYPEATSLRYINRAKIQKLATNYFSKAYFSGRARFMWTFRDFGGNKLGLNWGVSRKYIEISMYA